MPAGSEGYVYGWTRTFIEGHGRSMDVEITLYTNMKSLRKKPSHRMIAPSQIIKDKLVTFIKAYHQTRLSKRRCNRFFLVLCVYREKTSLSVQYKMGL